MTTTPTSNTQSRPHPKISLENLIFLSFTSPNTAFTTVTTEAPEYVRIDLENGMWYFEKQYETRQGRIGEDRRDNSWGFIGVYDRTNLDHLNRMLFHSYEATTNDRSW